MTESLTLKGDVDFKTGNLRFKGDVHIAGAVQPGFGVSAEGSIYIGGGVEAGAALNAKGDISVAQGIVGRKTRVVAAGHVGAQFVREARVVAAGDILIEELVHRGRLRAGGKVVVGDGRGQGRVAGAQVWAQGGIDVCAATSTNGVASVLVAGISPEQARALDRLRNRIETSHRYILQLLQHFHLHHVDVVQIRMLIAAAAGARRKLLAQYARQLGQWVQTYQAVLSEKQHFEESMEASVREAEIRVRDAAFPGVVVRLGKCETELREAVESACFRVEGDRLVCS